MNRIKKLIPRSLINYYHFGLAVLASLVYRQPSKGLIVIGVTGTKGKTSTINYIWQVLNSNGVKTGIITTANVRIGDTEIVNPFHMTMPGRFVIQKFLRKMVRDGCECAIVETTSQGIAQYRHIGIHYDVALFTNLTPEHIDYHKTFDNYRMMKGKLFETLAHTKIKKFRGHLFPKTIIANADSEYAPYFMSFKADRKESYSIELESKYKASAITPNNSGVDFILHDDKYSLAIPGTFNVYNALPAIIIGEMFGISKQSVRDCLGHLSVIPGRMEEIQNNLGFRVFVDYAHEKYSMTYAVETANMLKAESGKSIILLGAEGGGRDKAKRGIMGEIVGKFADVVVVSNVDSYDDDPTPIVEDIAVSAEQNGKTRGVNMFVIEDRREGIRKCLTEARAGDVVVIACKGAEQSMTIEGVTIPWDDRVVTREELSKLKQV